MAYLESAYLDDGVVRVGPGDNILTKVQSELASQPARPGQPSSGTVVLQSSYIPRHPAHRWMMHKCKQNLFMLPHAFSSSRSSSHPIKTTLR